MHSWLFQSNPKIFDVDLYLQNYDIISWTIRQKHFDSRISVNDEVYIWRSDGLVPKSAGIVAKGVIATLPGRMPLDPTEYWLDQDKIPTTAWGVAICIHEVRLTKQQGMLCREDKEKEPLLRDMTILKMRNNTNYLLRPSHAGRIQEIWEQHRTALLIEAPT